MFKNDYKNAIDKISPDGYIKQKVLNKIKQKNNKKLKISKPNIIRMASALAACFAIVFSIWIVNSENKHNDVINLSQPSNVESTVENVTTEKMQTYADIFKVISEIQAQIKANNVDDYQLFTEGDTEMYHTADSPTTSTANSANGSSINKDNISHSETTTQVKGVNESDCVKTDGEYIYQLFYPSVLRIIKAGTSPEIVFEEKLGTDKFFSLEEMYVCGDKLIIPGMEKRTYNSKIFVYDISEPENTKKIFECSQSGFFSDSRVINDRIYIISNYNFDIANVNKDDYTTFIPQVSSSNFSGCVDANTVDINNCNTAKYTVVCCFSLKDGTLLGTQSVLGGTGTVYCSTENLITTSYSHGKNTTVTRFALNGDGSIEFKARAEIKGNLLNQYSIDEYKGNFRFVTTVNEVVEKVVTDDIDASSETSTYVTLEQKYTNSLYILNAELKEIGAIENIAPDERVYSVRFMGNVGYFVTFRNVDPLFSIDLSNPQNPKIIGALKIPGFSNYLFPFGEGKLLGIGRDADVTNGRTKETKFSIFDISNPANVTESVKYLATVAKFHVPESHKAVLIDTEKSIFGYASNNHYAIYSFKNNQFNLEWHYEFKDYANGKRGVIIDNKFYVVTAKAIAVLDINNNFKTLNFKWYE